MKIYIRQIIPYLALPALFLLAAAGPIHAQTYPPARSSPVYDPATEVTLNGTIEAVKQVKGPRGWAGTHLSLKTDTGTIDVHAGPSWFLARNKVSLQKGDEIEVTGSKVKFNGSDAVIVRELKKDGTTVTLRNAQGIPAWSRGRRGN
ncbi:MAG: hypothetical protein ACRD4Y_16990 [Candidatus Acidiferrales bacterium]